jgi:hypothetical protein
MATGPLPAPATRLVASGSPRRPAGFAPTDECPLGVAASMVRRGAVVRRRARSLGAGIRAARRVVLGCRTTPGRAGNRSAPRRGFGCCVGSGVAGPEAGQRCFHGVRYPSGWPVFWSTPRYVIGFRMVSGGIGVGTDRRDIVGRGTSFGLPATGFTRRFPSGLCSVGGRARTELAPHRIRRCRGGYGGARSWSPSRCDGLGCRASSGRLGLQ